MAQTFFTSFLYSDLNFRKHIILVAHVQPKNLFAYYLKKSIDCVLQFDKLA